MAQFMGEVHGFLEEDLMVPSPLDMDIKVRACERAARASLLCRAYPVSDSDATVCDSDAQSDSDEHNEFENAGFPTQAAHAVDPIPAAKKKVKAAPRAKAAPREKAATRAKAAPRAKAAALKKAPPAKKSAAPKKAKTGGGKVAKAKQPAKKAPAAKPATKKKPCLHSAPTKVADFYIAPQQWATTAADRRALL
jgi:hypothetical protein